MLQFGARGVAQTNLSMPVGTAQSAILEENGGRLEAVLSPRKPQVIYGEDNRSALQRERLAYTPQLPSVLDGEGLPKSLAGQIYLSASCSNPEVLRMRTQQGPALGLSPQPRNPRPARSPAPAVRGGAPPVRPAGGLGPHLPHVWLPCQLSSYCAPGARAARRAACTRAGAQRGRRIQRRAGPRRDEAAG